MNLKLKEMRMYRNISQNKLTREIRVSVQYLNQVENGTKQLSLAVANDIADYFHCSIDELIGRTQTTNE